MSLSGQRQELRTTSRVVREAARGLYRSRLPQMAAALAYRTIFGLIPVMVVGLVVLRFFTSTADLHRWVDQAMEYTGIAEIGVTHRPSPRPATGTGEPDAAGDEHSPGVDAQAGVEADPGPPVAVDGEPRATAHPIIDPDEPANMAELIQSLVDRVLAIKFGAVGIIGALTLIYAALSMLIEIERAFNHVYRAPAGRPWGRRITLYWTMLTLGGVGLVATFVVGERFKSWVETLAEAGRLPMSGSFALAAAGFASTVAISTLLFVFLYSAVPHARVKFRAALAGAFVAAILWETGKWGFTQYIAFSTSYARLYGSIALIPLFLLWVYVTWLVVLFGLQVSYGVQYLGSAAHQRDEPDGPELVDPSAGVGMLAELARRFGEGGSATIDELGDSAGLSGRGAELVLARLDSAGLVHHVAKGEETGRYALARPPESIELARVREALSDPDATSDHTPASASIVAYRGIVRGAIGSRTLADVLGASATRAGEGSYDAAARGDAGPTDPPGG